MMYLCFVVLLASVAKLGYAADLVHTCNPDGSVEVTNPNPGLYTNVFAVQDEGTTGAVKCTVSTSGAQSNITGCSQDNTIVVWFSNRVGTVETFAGTSALSYEIQCNELPVSGIARTVANWLTADIEVTTQDSVTPSFTISSALRITSQLGSPTSSATVGDTLYWTIDIPSEYTAIMDCTAYSGTSSAGTPTKFLVDDGCEQDSNLMGSDFNNTVSSIPFNNTVSSIPSTTRYYATLYVFKFYNSDDIFFACDVTVCPAGSSSCDISCSKKKRSVGAKLSKGPDDRVFSTSSLIHILPNANSATNVLGNLWLAVAAGLMTKYYKMNI